jgi:hypothetical protein
MSTEVELEITLTTRVVITKDGQGRWFARGLDIDYAAQGQSLLEVEKAFESGFVATVQEHVNVYGHIENFTKAAPDHVISKYLEIAEALAADEVIIGLKGLKKYNAAEFHYYREAA